MDSLPAELGQAYAQALLAIARVDREIQPEEAARVRELVSSHTEPPTFGFLGRARVNVLELNLALDEAFGVPPVARSTSK